MFLIVRRCIYAIFKSTCLYLWVGGNARADLSEGHKGQSQEARRERPKTSNRAINWVGSMEAEF